MSSLYQIFKSSMNDTGSSRTKNRVTLLNSGIPGSKDLKDATSSSNQSLKKGLYRSSLQPDDSSSGVEMASFTEARYFLSHFGENPDLSPLLKPVMPWIQDQDNEFTSALTGKDKFTLLRGLLVNILKGVSQTTHLALLFDDIQVTVSF